MTDNDCEILKNESDRCLYAWAYNAIHFGKNDMHFVEEAFDRLLLVLAYKRGLWHGSK